MAEVGATRRRARPPAPPTAPPGHYCLSAARDTGRAPRRRLAVDAATAADATAPLPEPREDVGKWAAFELSGVPEECWWNVYCVPDDITRWKDHALAPVVLRVIVALLGVLVFLSLIIDTYFTCHFLQSMCRDFIDTTSFVI